MRFVLIIILFTSTSLRADDWSPPKDPDPYDILREARADASAKRYEIALAKHVWFHENAVKINRALSGVRLSFALSDWKSLGQDYPPALEKLRQVRNRLAAQANEGIDIGRGFCDLAAINSKLDEESKTTDAFEILDVKNPEAARRAFYCAKPALIKEKKYALFVKYVDPKVCFHQIKHLYKSSLQTSKGAKVDSELLKYANMSFRCDSATLVAILVINNRKLEATEIAVLAKKELKDAEFHKELEAALAGVVPVPWP